MSTIDTLIHEVVTESSAAAQATSGGVSAGSGQTIVTGDSSASVQVVNVVQSSSDGGTSHTVIEKTVDGVTTREEETKNFAPGEPVVVEVEAHADSTGTHNTTQTVDVDVTASSTSSDSTSYATTTTNTEDVPQTFGNYIVEAISSLFSNVWSFLVK